MLQASKENLLFDVRCPFEKPSKDGKLYRCNRICVKVAPGSSGEARCRSCHKEFVFEISDQARMTTGVRVKKTEYTPQELEQKWT